MTHVYQTTELGELIAAAFDTAARYSTDPIEVSRLAVETVSQMLRRSARASVSALLPDARALSSFRLPGERVFAV